MCLLRCLLSPTLPASQLGRKRELASFQLMHEVASDYGCAVNLIHKAQPPYIVLPGAGQQTHALAISSLCTRSLHLKLSVVLQAVANDSSSSTVQLTSSMRQVLMDRVDAYGDHHTLRCLALASRPMASSNEPVGHPSLRSAADHCCVRLCPFCNDRLRPASSSVLCRWLPSAVGDAAA